MKLYLNKINVCLKIFAFVLMTFVFFSSNLNAQDEWALETATMKMSKVFTGIVGGAGKANFNFSNGFFPNDYNIIGFRGQQGDANMGSGFKIGVTKWFNPFVDSVQRLPVYGPVNEYSPVGKVTKKMTNYIRYKFPNQEINFQSVDLENFGEYDPTKFGNHTYDQIIEVTNQYIFGIEMKRKIMSWSQNLNDNYVIFDLEFENKSEHTFDSLYISMEGNQPNSYLSNGRNPYVPSNEQYNMSRVWQHYYGGRVGDTARVFYEYSADNPDKSGDDMGAPVVTQNGRLVGADLYFYSILHASKETYTNVEQDVDDFSQPRVTYVGTATKIPYNADQDDQYGSKNYWTMAGGYSNAFAMTGNTVPGTHHGGNTDELGVVDFSSYPAGTKVSANSKMFSTFGPYFMSPGEKIHIVYAIGYAGIGIQKAQEVGQKWLKGILEDPKDLPNATTGYFPDNFVFPVNASENDKIKDRWVSTGIDSVMKTAYRAKWNFDHNYKIPQAPPPPSKLYITGHGDGVEIVWENLEAESMSNFAGYRISRRRTNFDTTYYQIVYDSDENDIATEHIFKDKDILVGAEYYYYLQAKAKIDDNDLLADPLSRGKIILSSRLLVPDILKINPPREPQEELSKIRIAPNPYNLNDPLLREYFGQDQRGIIFFNLPGTCTIRIYTENGDLVRTIDHNNQVKTGIYIWDMLTSSQQIVNSGLYIAAFEKPGGESSYQKFIIIR